MLYHMVSYYSVCYSLDMCITVNFIILHYIIVYDITFYHIIL